MRWRRAPRPPRSVASARNAAVRRSRLSDPVSMASAYIDGLKMLGRRELSEKQVRQRLARKQYEQDEIDEAVARLREERALDDRRVAEAIARTETGIRKRGKLRVRMELERAGIAKDIAKAAIDSVFDAIDDTALL